MGKKNDEHAKKVGELLDKYLAANLAKNAAQNEEKKTKATLEIELANYGEPFIHKVSDNLYLEAKFVDEEDEVIDPKLMHEKHPELFWQLVSVPKTDVIKLLSAKEAAQVTTTRDVHKFAIKKHKSKPQ